MNLSRKLILALNNNAAYLFLFFILLVPMLFMADGKLSFVDVFGAAAVSFFYFYTTINNKQLRIVPPAIDYLWFLFLIYLLFTLINSDDIGFSLYGVLRYIEAYLIVRVIFCYHQIQLNRIFINLLLFFCLMVLILAIFLTYSSRFVSTLPSMNLLYPTYGHNHVADLLLFGYAISIALYMMIPQAIYKYIAIILYIGILFSVSRAAILLASCCLIMATLLALTKIKQPHPFIIIGSLISIVVSVIFLYAKPIDLKSGIFKYSGIKAGVMIDSRYDYWRQAIAAMRERPLFGSGPGTFYLQSRRLQLYDGRYSYYAHNLLLETAVEIGIVGLILIGSMLVGSIKKCIYYIQKIHDSQRPIVLSLLYGLMTLFIYSLMEYSLNYLLVWLVFWLTFGVVISNTASKT